MAGRLLILECIIYWVQVWDRILYCVLALFGMLVYLINCCDALQVPPFKSDAMRASKEAEEGGPGGGGGYY